jgi:transposase InsO family protein
VGKIALSSPASTVLKDEPMTDTTAYEKLPLPTNWSHHVKSAVLQTIALAHVALAHVRGMCAGSSLARMRLRGKLDKLEQEVTLLREEMRIKDARMGRIDARRRPQYLPAERLQILEMMASCGWSMQQAAESFMVTGATVSSWMRRRDEDGPDALLATSEPVNRFPDHVRYLVQRLKTLCPSMGPKKIVGHLARAGLHMAASTARRITNEPPAREPAVKQESQASESPPEPKSVKADRPDHVWGIDFTLVPILGGFWTTWLPFALPQCWPFCYWVMAVTDHYSRKVHKLTAFRKQPTSRQVCAVLTKLVVALGKAPRHIVTDRGGQFDCDHFRDWCFPHIKNRYGAVGKYGSIAVIERLMRTLKSEHTRRLSVPMNIGQMQTELGIFACSFNSERPHEFLGGRTPDEVYQRKAPANERPRWEPRENWPRKSSCAAPQVPVRGPCGVKLALEVEPFEGRRHLPVIRLSRVG